jgi:hypothetical protein
VERPYCEKDAEFDEKAVINCLHRSGWIAKTWESDSRLMIQWSEKGKSGIVSLNELIQDAEVGDLNGRQLALFSLIAFASYRAGMDANNVTAIGEADLTRESTALRDDAA